MQIVTVNYSPDSPPKVEQRLPVQRPLSDMPVLLQDVATPHMGSTMLHSIWQFLDRKRSNTIKP